MADSAHPLNFLQLIADEVRWQILLVLVEDDWRVQEITARVGQPQNLVSYHLQKLKQAGLVLEKHSQADARAVYYHLQYDQIQHGLKQAGAAFAPQLSPLLAGESQSGLPLRVLFVCTHNSARSQMAEAMLRAWGGGRVQVSSAGSDPRPIHPLAVQVMAERQIDLQGQTAKGWEALAGQAFDVVITVCDLARERCPVFPGNPLQIHWSVPDPATGSGELARFQTAADDLARRVQAFIDRLPAQQDPITD